MQKGIKTMKKIIITIITIIALVVIIGSLGAYGNNTIGFGRCLLQSAIALAVEWFCLETLNK